MNPDKNRKDSGKHGENDADYENRTILPCIVDILIRFRRGFGGFSAGRGHCSGSLRFVRDISGRIGIFPCFREGCVLRIGGGL